METCGNLKNVFLAQNETHDHEAVGNVDDGDGSVCATSLVARFHCPSKIIYLYESLPSSELFISRYLDSR